ncbi:MAG: amino acid permease [Candidatus Micrarchaeia archaeon]|jgi:APA family basic amino acid/polyamine antiporter
MVELKRALGFWELTLTGIGIILGAGIYVLIGEAAGVAGNTVWLSFLIAAGVAALSGLSYAELASLFPKAGAEFVFTEKAFNKRLAFVIGWLLLISPIISVAAVSLGFAGYFNAFFNTPIILTAVGSLAVLSIILFYGIKESAWFAIICSIVEILGLIAVVFLAIPYLGSVDYFEFPAEFGMAGVFSAAALIFFAYIGFDEIVNMAEEVKDPTKIVPKATLFAIVISTILYILVAISAISVMNWEVLGESTAPLADVVSHSFLGNDAFFIMGIIALFATANTILLILLAASRMIYGMARGKVLPEILGRLHKKRQTPWVAIILLFILSSLFVLLGNINLVANMTNITILIPFFIVNVSAIVLRYKMPNIKRNFKIPLNIGKFPVLAFFGALSCLLLIAQIEIEVIFFGLLIVLLGFLISYIFVKKDFNAEKLQRAISKK